jgi:glycerol-1-phosphate dehydrogenase [NAD(P)+]
MKTEGIPSVAECLELATDTWTMITERGALDRVPEVYADAFPCTAAVVVADGNTWKAAGERVRNLLAGAGIALAEPYVFPAEPVIHGSAELAGLLASELERRSAAARMHCVPVSVGAGTINDIVKRAASERGVPYLCVPTAASVDGYTSYGAALLSGGFKKTLQCAAPLAVVADTEVLAAAPAYLSSSGFGDLASKLVAGTDWVIACAAGRGGASGWEPIDERAWAMTQLGLRDALAASETAAAGDAEAVRALFTALAVTGFSMQYLKSSRPVSGCEHLFSHVWEMADLSVGGIPVTHGHKVAIGTLIATAVTEKIFASSEPPKAGRTAEATFAEREARVRAAFGGAGVADDAVETSRAKFLPPAARERLRESVAGEWRTLRDRVRERLVPCAELSEQFRRARCPRTAEEIGLGRAQAIATGLKAQMIRNRYTVLDLAWDFGVLEAVLADLEAAPRILA